MYDYYFLENPHRKYDDGCEYDICEKSILYRRLLFSVQEYDKLNNLPSTKDNGCVEIKRDLRDVLEYMLYNVSGDTGLPAYYSCCMSLYNKDVVGLGAECEEDGFITPNLNTRSDHVCNAIPIMIGSSLEKKIITRLAEMLCVRVSEIYDTDYLHKVYSGSFLVNGIFYYSVFRESNNNKICHNTKSKYRGEETVAYFYDNTCNRGVKLFTNRSGQLLVNDRDGNEVTDVTSEVILQLYKECLQNWRNYTLDMHLIKGFFSSVKRQGLTGIDMFKNKIYTNYSIGLNTSLDKLPTSAMSNPMWNSSLMIGKINLGISQRLVYPKSKSETKKLNEQKLKMCTGGLSTGYLVETQRRRNLRKVIKPTHVTQGTKEINHEEDIIGKEKVSSGEKRDYNKSNKGTINCVKNKHTEKDVTVPTGPESVQTTSRSAHTILGSKEVKTGGLMEKLEQGDHNGPSTFNQVSVSYLPLIRVLSSTVQKLQVEHVHAESSKTVPRDAYGFICMKYMGNISTAGKNMLFVDRVQVSYGHVHKVIEAVEKGIETLVRDSQHRTFNERLVILRNDHHNKPEIAGTRRCMYLVINNAVTVWEVSSERILEFIIYIKTRCHRFAWTKLVGNYLCIYYYEGVPLLRYNRQEIMFDLLSKSIDRNGGNSGFVLEGIDSLYFSRDELEMFASTNFTTDIPVGKSELVETTNRLIENWSNMRHGEDEGGSWMEYEHSSLLAKHLDQYTEYTAPAKRSVSVNARKSALINVYYQRAADLIRGFNIFADPDGYEQSTAKQVATNHRLPEWVTLRDFTRARAQLQNCPQPYNGESSDRSLDNFYMLRTIFADIAGCNVEDANVLDESVDLNLSYSYSFSLTIVDKTKRGLDIIVPPPRNSACVCCWDREGNPTTVLFLVCTIRKKEDECSSRIEEMLRQSPDLRFVNSLTKERREPSDQVTSPPTDYENKFRSSSVDGIIFPPFRKLSVIKSEDGNYHVYFMRNDAVLLRSIHKLRKKLKTDMEMPNMSNATRLAENEYAFVCKPEVNPYDALTSLQTRITTFETTNTEEEQCIVTVDVIVHGNSDKYDGVKVVNSFGQKGLALIRDLRPYFMENTPASHNVPVQLVMNNCSFVSRQPIGQLLQMKKNMYATTTSAANEPTSVGYTPVFFTETEPITKTCLVRFDEMMRSVIITLGLTLFQNLKSSLDNIYNPYGVLYPPQTRQIMSLYRCVGVSYKFSGDNHTPFSSRDDVKLLLKMYDIFMEMPKPKKMTASKALLGVMEVLGDENNVKRLFDIGVLREIEGVDNQESTCNTEPARSKTYVLHLNGQWIKDFDNCANSSTNDGWQTQYDYELRTYSSRDDTYRIVYIFGDPNNITDALSDRSTSISQLVKQITAAAKDGK